MQNNIFRKSLVFSVIVLFLGVGIYPSSAINTIKESIIILNRGNILYVGGSGEGNYTSIQDAIDEANDGDTIFVFNGTYIENVIIDKSIILRGENRDTTIIDGNFVDNTIWVKAPYVNINGFTVMNSINDGYSAGIIVKNIYVDILNCTIKNNDCGIRLTHTDTFDITNCNISNCKISNNFGHSIYIIIASQININQCEIYDNGDNFIGGGIHISGDPIYDGENQNIDISHCDIKNNNIDGISIKGISTNIRVHHNTISGNTKRGIIIRYGTWAPLSNISIYNNEIKNNGNGELFDGGIILQNCLNCVTVKYNTVSSNSIHGVFLLRSYNNKIIKNNFVDNIKSASYKYEPIGFRSTWDRNYWDRPRILPKPVFGILLIDHIQIPWVNLDWHPAKEPYDIT